MPKIGRDDGPRWRRSLSSSVVGGVCATENVVIIGTRDSADQRDQFQAFDAVTGRPWWTSDYPAEANLDYGNAPRATPTIRDGVVVTMGATGVLSGIDLASGLTIWRRSLATDFDLQITEWGFCASPLIVGDLVIVPVGEEPCVVAVDLYNGQTRWRVDGAAAGYASPVKSQNGKTFFGVDVDGYHERRIDDGTLVWSRRRQYDGDFGVPSPALFGRDEVIFLGENNGLLVRRGDGLQTLDDALIADTHTPVVIDGDVIVAHDGVHRIDGKNGSRKWSVAGDVVTGYASIICDRNHTLVTTDRAECLLLDNVDGTIKHRANLTDQAMRTLSHPAIVGERFYVVVGNELRCY